MASWVTHLVVGERVFAQLQQFGEQEYGAFLLGCVLVDVHTFSDVDRRATHFVGRLEEDGVDAFNKSSLRLGGGGSLSKAIRREKRG